MQLPKIKTDISVGMIIHFALMILAVAIGYGRVAGQFEENSRALQRVQDQTNRIEHYLQSKDPDYWKRSAENGDRYHE